MHLPRSGREVPPLSTLGDGAKDQTAGKGGRAGRGYEATPSSERDLTDIKPFPRASPGRGGEAQDGLSFAWEGSGDENDLVSASCNATVGRKTGLVNLAELLTH